MINATKKNTDRVARLARPLLDIDWTKLEGATPFFKAETYKGSGDPIINGFYLVSVDTGINNYGDLTEPVRSVALEAGIKTILDFYNKVELSDFNNFWLTQGKIVGHEENTQGIWVKAPPNPHQEASGTYVPIRPQENIKVLVQLPDLLSGSGVFVKDSLKYPGSYGRFSDLPEAPSDINRVTYDMVELNTFGLEEDVSEIISLLKNYHRETTDFDGKVYNLDFGQLADKIENFVPALKNLVQNNGIIYSNAQSDLISFDMSGSGRRSEEYRPFNAMINQGRGFVELPSSFQIFRESGFTESNVMYIFRHLGEIVEATNQRPTISSEGRPQPAVTWEKFLRDYIHFPPAIVEYTAPRPTSPDRATAEDHAIASADAKPVHTAESLKQEDEYFEKPKFKNAVHARQKKIKNFVGDNILGNLDKTIHGIRTVEDVYSKYLNKLGLRAIVDAAIKCMEIDLPIEEAKAFLLDARNLTREIVKILSVPVLTLDDMIPTVDMMGDIVKQVVMAILEALLRTLLTMVKQIVLMYLEACGDPCKLNFGNFSLQNMIAKGADAVVGGVSTSLSRGGNTPLLDSMTGTSNTGLKQNSRKFLENLNSKLTEEQIQGLTTPIKTSGLSDAISQSPVGQFFDSISTTLTCGEVGKLMQGNTPPEAVKVIQRTACSLASAPDANPGFIVLCNLFSDKEKIDDFFGNVGKVADLDPITQQIEAMEEMIPSITNGLCDADDSFLRCQLLAGKGINNRETCLAQVNASRFRARSRIDQISDLLDSNDPLKNAIPPIYCKTEIVNGQVRIIEGLIPRDHPTFLHMFDKTLDTTFFGVYRAFI